MPVSRCGPLAGMLLLTTLGACATAVAHGADLRSVTIRDLDGTDVRPLASLPASAPGAVFIFTRSDCPIANRYAPELERLRQRAAAAGIQFWLVFVDPAESASAIRDHLRTYGYAGRALRDPSHVLARVTGATIAPEAAVFARSESAPRLVYRGRIDDRYRDAGRMRPAATTHDLADAIEGLRAARPLVLRETQAVGCVIADLQ